MKNHILIFVLVVSIPCFSQINIFDTSTLNKQISQKSFKISNLHQKKDNVNNTYIGLDIKSNFLHSKNITFYINGKKYSASLLKKNVRSENDFTWFGKTSEGNGVFFCVKDNKIASKFSTNDYSYTLIPLDTNNHLLIEYNNTNVGFCGNEFDSSSIKKPLKSIITTFSNDDECTLRVLLATTPTSRMQIANSGFDLPTFAQVMIDEANLAYIMSQIDITMELAILIETNYSESMGNNHLTDVTRFRNGTNGLNIAHTYRNIYQTDIQVLIRRNESGIFGRVFEVPTGSNFNQTNGFATVSVDGVTDGRYSFTHEVGHLQGGRHDNHNASPNYARGFVSGSGTNAWRTIMARTGNSCTKANSCRIGSFSNPNVNGPGGVASGNNDRNNARRLNESANIINSYRLVPTNLLMQNETIPANYVSNHLAKNTIDTDNSNIFYQSNSNGTMRAEQEIVLKPGVFIQEGSNYRAYIINKACENNPSSKQSNIDNEKIKKELLEIKLYPNPSSQDINISFNRELNDFSIEIYNVNSNKKVFSRFYENSSDTINIYTTNFKSGLYILKITSKIEGEITSSKFIKN